MKHSLQVGKVGRTPWEGSWAAQQYESVNIKINEQWRGVEYNEAVKIESSSPASAILTSSSWG